VTVTKAGYYRYEALVPVVDVGIQEGHESIRDFATVSLYPVVSRDFFTLQYGFSAKTTVCVSIYNALGHLVDHQDYGKLVGTGDLTLNFPSLAQGVYFVKIDAGDQTTTTKVIFVK
jgi:hypothetical protein